MSTVTADEIASALGLKDGAHERMIADYLLTRNGSKRTPSLSVKERAAEERERIDKVMDAWDNTENPDLDGLTASVFAVSVLLLFEPFADFYLVGSFSGRGRPSLSSSKRQSSPTGSRWRSQQPLDFRSPAALKPSFARFATQDRLLTKDLLNTTCQALATQMSLDDLTVMDKPDGITVWEKMTRILVFIIRLILHDSNGRYPPRPTSTSSTAFLLERIEPFRLEIEALSPAAMCIPESGKKRLRDTSVLLLLLSEMLGKGDMREEDFGPLQGLPSHQWYRCAGRLEDGQPCRELGEGEEMEACGKCRTVRYCSREHQRAHWKVHKKLCWEPVW